ncbi:MAG: M16 family metallopeptidase [Spirochaetales bacterium]
MGSFLPRAAMTDLPETTAAQETGSRAGTTTGEIRPTDVDPRLAMIQPIVLPAGSVFLTERRRDSPSFAISLWFPLGSRNEAPETRGFVHFLEHMLFKGTGKREAFSLWRAIERTGGYANGFTERDGLCVYFCVPSAEWRLAVELIAEVAFSSTFPLEEFDREKQVILAEIAQVEDDIEETAFDAFLERFWPDQPVAKPIAGTRAEVEAIDREKLFAFYRETITPGNAVIAASGDYAADLIAGAMNEAILSALLAGGRGAASEASTRGPALIPSRTPAARTFRGYTRAPSSQVYYFEALQLDPPLFARDFFCLGVVNGVLGEASTSRLFQKVREKLGLAYTVQSSLSFAKTEALLLVQAATESPKLGECLQAVDGEIEKFLSQGLGEEELREAKSRLSGSFLLSMEDPESRIRRLASWYFFAGTIPEIGEEMESYLSVGEDEIRHLLGRLSLAPRGRYAYGSVKAAAARTLGFKEI